MCTVYMKHNSLLQIFYYKYSTTIILLQLFYYKYSIYYYSASKSVEISELITPNHSTGNMHISNHSAGIVSRSFLYFFGTIVFLLHIHIVNVYLASIEWLQWPSEQAASIYMACYMLVSQFWHMTKIIDVDNYHTRLCLDQHLVGKNL